MLTIVGLLSALALFGLNVKTTLAGLGIGGLAIALAAQKSLENLIGGISLLMDKAVRVGDVCQIGDHLDTVEEIAEECRLLGVDLVSLRQNIDTTLPAGRLTFQILGAAAEFERELLRERVKSGMAQAKRSGKHVGRTALRNFGAAEIERMKLLRSRGTSIRKLAADFGTTQWMAARIIAQSASQI